VYFGVSLCGENLLLAENLLDSFRYSFELLFHFYHNFNWQIADSCIEVPIQDNRGSFGLKIGLIGHINTRPLTILNYSAITNSHTLQMTTERAKSCQSVVTGSFLLKNLRNGDSSTSVPYCTD
jgi:hypothetical protein